MKKAVAIGIIVLIVFGVLIFFLNDKKENVKEFECKEDNECVPATCCHPNSCVSVSKSPNCSGIYCTAVCEPGTLDCGQAKCGCVNNKCQAIFK